MMKGMRCEMGQSKTLANIPTTCSYDTCRNGGRCIQYTSASIICYCQKPYVGKYCETLPETRSLLSSSKSAVLLRKKQVCDYIVCPSGKFLY
jgi:hypothetical protein